MVAYQKIAESKDQFEFAIEASELGTFDYNPITNRFSANERLKQWFGLPPDSDIELHHAINVIAEEDRQRVMDAIQQTLQFSSGGQYNIQYKIIHPVTKKETIVRAKGRSWFNEDKISFRFTGTLQDITQQVLDGKKIAQSEQRFQAAIKAVNGVLWTNNALGEMEDEQPGWANLTGQTYQEYKGFGWAKAVHPDDSQPTIDAWNEAVRYRKTFIFEHRVKMKDKKWGHFSIKAVPILNTDGAIREWVGVHTNITQSKREAENLKKNEEKLNIVIDASELGTYELNMKTDELNFSQRLTEIFGYTNNKKLLHAAFLSQLHNDDIAKRNNAFKTAIATGILHYESRIIWKDKSVHWIAVKGKVFFDKESKPDILIGTAMDITDEKNYQLSLMESEQKFRLLAESMPQHIWTADAQGNLNYFNRSVFDYSGLSLTDIEIHGWLQIVHPDEREENIRQWTHSITTGNDFIFEHRFKRYDGAYRWQLSRAIPQKDATGNIQKWVGTSTDIQEMKEQEQQKDFFIGMVSHELKTPVTTMKAYIELLKIKYSNSEDSFLKKSLETIEKQIQKNIKLISELLDVSKIKSGNLALNKEFFVINELVKEAIEELSYINPGYKIIITRETAVNVCADRDRIRQVLINLITNAIKYSPDNNEVEVKIENDSENVTVSIKDRGIGINNIDQKRIFERFYRVEGKSEKTFPGFGIGLFIAAEIIEKHGGKINVKSEPGVGSVFWFTLPLKY